MRCVSSICVFKFSAMFPDNQMLSGGGGGGAGEEQSAFANYKLLHFTKK